MKKKKTLIQRKMTDYILKNFKPNFCTQIPLYSFLYYYSDYSYGNYDVFAVCLFFEMTLMFCCRIKICLFPGYGECPSFGKFIIYLKIREIKINFI